jgi:DNA-damage-inducible protein D
MCVDSSGENPFHIEPQMAGFESLGNSNGFRFWWASDLSVILGYETPQGFRKAIERAMMALSSLNIPIYENIVEQARESEAGTFSDFKLSRFACYLAAMNGDPKKVQVAKAQQYFIAWAEACRLSLAQSESVERVAVRAEISDHEKTLAGTAKAAGVVEYGLFQNAGYRGMYNMNLSQIRFHKGVPDGRSPLDFMGKTELAANLFRVTQTEEKIRAEQIKGQANLQNAAEKVGKKVRTTMIEISGKRPEDLPAAEDIRNVHKRMKNSHREIKKLDKPKD